MSPSPHFEPPSSAAEDASMSYVPEDDAPRGAPAEAARRHERELMAIDGVVGVRPGRTAIGDDAIVLLLRDASVAARTPDTIEGLPVEKMVTGPIDAAGS